MSLSARCTSRAEAQAPAPRLPVKRHPGAVRAIADPDNIKAEFAILVRDLKGRGLGHLLLDKLIRYQRAHGTQPSWASCCARTTPCTTWHAPTAFAPIPAAPVPAQCGTYWSCSRGDYVAYGEPQAADSLRQAIGERHRWSCPRHCSTPRNAGSSQLSLPAPVCGPHSSASTPWRSSQSP